MKRKDIQVGKEYAVRKGPSWGAGRVLVLGFEKVINNGKWHVLVEKRFPAPCSCVIRVDGRDFVEASRFVCEWEHHEAARHKAQEAARLKREEAHAREIVILTKRGCLPCPFLQVQCRANTTEPCPKGGEEVE